MSSHFGSLNDASLYAISPSGTHYACWSPDRPWFIDVHDAEGHMLYALQWPYGTRPIVMSWREGVRPVLVMLHKIDKKGSTVCVLTSRDVCLL